MIYLRPSRRIKSAESDDRIIISDSLLDEYLDRLISLNADKRPFNLHLEASNGVVLDEQSTTATELSLRVYTHDGVDITSLVKTLSPSWQIEGKEVGQGLSYTAQSAKLKSWHTKITVMTTVARILDAMGKLDKLEQGVRRVLEEQEVKTSIELRKDSILLQHIPTTELIRQSLKEDRQFIASVKGDKGDAGQDAAPMRPNLLRGLMGAEKLTASALGSANVHTRLGIKPFLELGKRYVLSADFELTEGTANAVSLGLLTTSGTFLSEAKNPLNGTKTRVSLQISLDASANLEEIVDVLGYAGERGKTRGNIAKYYNIKLEEVTSDTDKASAYLPHPDDLKGADGKSVSLEDLKIKWEGDRLNIAGYKSDSLTGSAGKDAVPVRPNLFDFACLSEAHQKIGLSFDDLAAKRKLSPLSVTIRQTSDTSRLCTGVALQFDINVRRAQKESGKFTRRPTLRIMRGDAVLLVSNGAYISEQAGTYHYEVVRSISKAIAQHEQGFYVHAWITDYGAGLLDCEVSNIKIEYLYEGEPQQCSIYTPKPSDMIPLSPRIIDGRWYIADTLTRKYTDSGIKALGVDGKSVTAQEVTATLKGDSAFLASVKGDKGDRGVRGLKGEDGKSPTPEEVAGVINTPAWQALLADQTARKVTDSDAHLAKIREGMAMHDQLDNVAQIGQQAITLAQSVASEEYQSHIINQTLVQMDDKTKKLIQKYATRSIPSRITPQAGRFNIVRVPNFDDPELTPPIAVGATISLNVFIAPPVGSGCVYGAKTADEHGYFFLLQSSNYIFTTDAQPLGTEVKVYYNSEMCATENLTVRLERAESHWIFLNYYDFGAGVQAKYTKTRLQSHYSNNSQSQSLEYAPFQYLSGTKRDVYLPLPITGLTIKVWANFWVGDVTVRATNGVSLHDTSRGEANNVGNTGVTIPKGHIGEFVCLGDIWLYTDLSR